MTAATKPRNVRTFTGHGLMADLMAAVDRHSIAQRIGRARDESGLTQAEVADLMHVHPRTVQNWESNARPIVAFDRLEELAGIIGTSKFWLLHGTELPGSAEDAATLAEIVRRLESLEVQVAKLATRDHLRRGLETLRAAIDAQATPGTRRDRTAV